MFNTSTQYAGSPFAVRTDEVSGSYSPRAVGCLVSPLAPYRTHAAMARATQQLERNADEGAPSWWHGGSPTTPMRPSQFMELGDLATYDRKAGRSTLYSAALPMEAVVLPPSNALVLHPDVNVSSDIAPVVSSAHPPDSRAYWGLSPSPGRTRGGVTASCADHERQVRDQGEWEFLVRLQAAAERESADHYHFGPAGRLLQEAAAAGAPIPPPDAACTPRRSRLCDPSSRDTDEVATSVQPHNSAGRQIHFSTPLTAVDRVVLVAAVGDFAARLAAVEARRREAEAAALVASKPTRLGAATGVGGPGAGVVSPSRIALQLPSPSPVRADVERATPVRLAAAPNGTAVVSGSNPTTTTSVCGPSRRTPADAAQRLHAALAAEPCTWDRLCFTRGDEWPLIRVALIAADGQLANPAAPTFVHGSSGVAWQTVKALAGRLLMEEAQAANRDHMGR
jgi:hypothetical protein